MPVGMDGKGGVQLGGCVHGQGRSKSDARGDEMIGCATSIDKLSVEDLWDSRLTVCSHVSAWHWFLRMRVALRALGSARSTMRRRIVDDIVDECIDLFHVREG